MLSHSTAILRSRLVRTIYCPYLHLSSSVAPQVPLWFNVAPKRAHPYMELARLDKPIGTWLVSLPSTWSIAFAANPGCLPDFGMLALFGAGALLMRGAGCTVNDIIDRDIDLNVLRTRDRPVARGSVSVSNAAKFLALQLLGAFVILLQLSPQTVFIGSCCLGPVFAYPLFKRF
ncbi:unnamed protein product, partial [Hydatigera taeniaeformis]|uniref:4-hydroxybenzoate polyprenyltransferase, mitochondrial n=1 Tax=Hydatigena taeniaeformis TaxID=6205 RepID=A0A0R3WU49_HYDTA